VGQVPVRSSAWVSLMDTGTESLPGKTVSLKGEVQKRETRKPIKTWES